MNCLREICNKIGQKVSSEKTRIYFSSKTSDDIKDRIVALSGFSKIDDLGTYLGMPMLHGRKTRSDFNRIVDRVKRKLAG